MNKIILDLNTNIEDITISHDTKIYGLFIGKKMDSSKNSFNIYFDRSNIKLEIFVKAVLKDKSCFDFRPLMKVSKRYSGINATMKIEILNISKDTKIISTPAMEIEQPNISASHSLSISSFNSDQLNYLFSKGLSKDQAKKMLIDSFIKDIFIQFK